MRFFYTRSPPMLQSLLDLDPARFDRPDILKTVAKAARSLAELKGVAETIPNEGILLNTKHPGSQG